MTAQNYQLVDHNGQIYPIGVNGATIGRQGTNDIVVSDSRVSRQHARILLAADRCWIRDENSALGTFVNGQQVQGQQELKSGDILQIGNVNFRLGHIQTPQKSQNVVGNIRSKQVLVLGIGALVLLAGLFIFGSGGSRMPPASGGRLSTKTSGPNILTPDDDPPQEVTIYDDAVILEPSVSEKITAISTDGTIFFDTIPSELQNLKTEDILVSGVSSIAPEGFLRKVISISNQGGQLQIKTEQASLDEVIKEGKIHYHQTLSPDDVVAYTGQGRGVKLAKLVKPNGDSTTFKINLDNVNGGPGASSKWGKTGLSGEILFTSDLSMDMEFDDGLEFVNVELSSTEQANLTVRSSEFGTGVGVAVEVTRLHLATFTINAAIPIFPFVLPIPISVDLIVYAGVGGDVDIGLEHRVSQTSTFTVGATYDVDDGFYTYENRDINFDYTPPTVFVESSVRGYAGPVIFVKIYGVAGPFVGVDGYIKVTAHGGTDAYLELGSGIQIKAGFKFELKILTYKIEISKEGVVLDFYQVLHRHNFEPDVTITLTLTPSQTLSKTTEAPDTTVTPPATTKTVTPTDQKTPTQDIRKPIPDVIGLTPAEAEQKLKDAGFGVLPGDDGYSNTVAQGRIFDQAPDAGELYDPKNTIVMIYRSKGPKPSPTSQDSGEPYLNVTTTSLCRDGPSQLYDHHSYVEAGDRAKIIGKNPDGGWWLIQDPKKPSRECWVWDGAGHVSGDTSKIPIVDPPPPPTSEDGIGDVSVTQREIKIYLRDHSSVDGDRVDLIVNGEVIVDNYTITGSKKGFNVTLNSGKNTVTIKALNEGSESPNTVEVSISHVRIGNEVQISGKLLTGESDSFTIYAP